MNDAREKSAALMQASANTLYTVDQIVACFHLDAPQTRRLRTLLRGRAVRMPYRTKSEPWYRWSVVQEAVAALHDGETAAGAHPASARRR